MMSQPLACPSCATTHSLDERFCPKCGMPLVYAGAQGTEAPTTDRHERARKIKPQYAEGDLVRVAGGRNQAEAEFIQGMLLEEGVPSLLRRSRGFDVPDYLAAGPRDVMVPASGAPTAREVLLEAEILPSNASGDGVRPLRLLAGLLAACALVAVIAWLGTELI
jgi:zinc ribbon protein